MIPASWGGQWGGQRQASTEKKSEEKENKTVVLEVKGGEKDSYSRGLVK